MCNWSGKKPAEDATHRTRLKNKTKKTRSGATQGSLTFHPRTQRTKSIICSNATELFACVSRKTDGSRLEERHKKQPASRFLSPFTYTYAGTTANDSVQTLPTCGYCRDDPDMWPFSCCSRKLFSRIEGEKEEALYKQVATT